MRIVLPYPLPDQWPNKRPHWSAKARATRSYRQWAKLAANTAKPGAIRVTFCPKTFGPVPDMDNAIADAMGVNDRDLTFTYAMGNRCKDGAVIVEIGE